jgi:Invasin, domain 3
MLLVLSLLPAVGCDKATPVAPNGTILTISANPSKVGLNGRSTITVVGRKPDGNPLNPGTEIRLTTDKGTIDPIVTVEEGGRATATFRADGRSGVAKITAMTGGGMTMATTDVQVGESDTTRPTVIVSVTPSTIALEDEATVTVIARNADGSPVERGERVILTTTLGRLNPPNPTIQQNGTATSTLNAGSREGTATITAIVGSSAPATTTATIVLDVATAISVTATPSSIPASSGGTIIVTATVINSRAQAVQGALVTFESELGSFEDTTAETTDDNGQASKRLIVTPADIPASDTSFEVRARTPSSAGGTFLEGSTDVRITRPTGGGT